MLKEWRAYSSRSKAHRHFDDRTNHTTRGSRIESCRLAFAPRWARDIEMSPLRVTHELFQEFAAGNRSAPAAASRVSHVSNFALNEAIEAGIHRQFPGTFAGAANCTQ